jgi:hypothetical protein
MQVKALIYRNLLIFTEKRDAYNISLECYNLSFAPADICQICTRVSNCRTPGELLDEAFPTLQSNGRKSCARVAT